MAGLGRKVFTAGDVLTASDLQSYAVDQSVMYFAGTAARSSAIATPTTGMTTYVGTTPPQVETYTGAAYQNLSGAVLLNTTTITAAATTTISNVFTTTYENYLIIGDISTAVGTAGSLQFKLTASGTPSGNFTTVGWQMGVSAGTGTSVNLGTGNQGGTSHPLCYIAATGQGGFTTTVMRPQIASNTGCVFGGAVATSDSGLTSNLGSAIHYSATSFDGFQLIAAGTSITGTIRVYGYRNS
jgi:hypothetical protein